MAEKTDWQALRAAGAAIRDHALENLGAYLEQFEERCTAAGGVVHWAADAAEARQIILKLLREENAREVIKIKTMTSAEIQLNPFLEAAGVRDVRDGSGGDHSAAWARASLRILWFRRCM